MKGAMAVVAFPVLSFLSPFFLLGSRRDRLPGRRRKREVELAPKVSPFSSFPLFSFPPFFFFPAASSFARKIGDAEHA